jgi:hypothetical protein
MSRVEGQVILESGHGGDGGSKRFRERGHRGGVPLSEDVSIAGGRTREGSHLKSYRFFAPSCTVKTCRRLRMCSCI